MYLNYWAWEEGVFMKVFKVIFIAAVSAILLFASMQMCFADSVDTKIEEKVRDIKLVFTLRGKKYELSLNPYTGNVVNDNDVNRNDFISLDEAKSIALKEAKLESADFKKVKLDYDDNKPIYEIEFKYDGKEYEYEIDGKTGVILESDVEYEGNYKNNTSEKYNVTAEEAENIALENANISRSSVKYIHSYIGRHNAKLVYEVEFEVGNIEYEYKIDVDNGEVLKNNMEKH